MNQCLIGCCPLMVTMVLKDHGGNASHATRYFTRLRFAPARIAIRFLGIAGSVELIVRCAMCGFEVEVENPWMSTAPILAFFDSRPRRERLVIPDVWICDLHK